MRFASNRNATAKQNSTANRNAVAEAHQRAEQRCSELRRSTFRPDGRWVEMDFDEVWTLMNVEIGFKLLEAFGDILGFGRHDIRPERHRLRLFRYYTFAALAFEDAGRIVAYVDCANKTVRLPGPRKRNGTRGFKGARDQSLMLVTGRQIEFVDLVSLAFKNFFKW